jgi:hypothetical protein
VKAELLLLGALGLGASGCVAEIHEERLFGGPHTITASRTETIEERPNDEAIGGGCREVALTYPMVRDVTVRRYFADDAQTRNVAAATLLGAGIAFLAYGTNQSACSAKTGACPDFAVVNTTEAILAALAAIPVAFIAYNAIRVQDTQTFEYLAPAWKRGPCKEREPHKDEKAAAQ